MKVDFVDAHSRHHENAEHLFAGNRLPNADHLFGLAAECGMKALMAHFGMPMTTIGDPQNPSDKVHIDRLWSRYQSYHASVTAPNLTLPATNPFDDWRIEQRYGASHEFRRPLVLPHRDGSILVKKLVDRAGREGILS
jgi:hypothetical protein